MEGAVFEAVARWIDSLSWMRTNNVMLSPVDYEMTQKKMNEADASETTGYSQGGPLKSYSQNAKKIGPHIADRSSAHT
jgi:hypothetical protein